MAAILAEGTPVRLLADMPAKRLWDRAGYSASVTAGAEGMVVQEITMRSDGAVVWKAGGDWTRAEALAFFDLTDPVDGYEVEFTEVTAFDIEGFEPGTRRESYWVYAPAGLLEVIA